MKECKCHVMLCDDSVFVCFVCFSRILLIFTLLFIYFFTNENTKVMRSQDSASQVNQYMFFIRNSGGLKVSFLKDTFKNFI